MNDPDPRLDPKAVPPTTDPLDPARDPRVPLYRRDYTGAGWGSGVALFALLAIAVLSLIWLFSGPNEPTQNTAQNTTITEPAPPVQPAQPEQPAQNQQPAQPEQPPPPAGTTQP